MNMKKTLENTLEIKILTKNIHHQNNVEDSPIARLFYSLLVFHPPEQRSEFVLAFWARPYQGLLQLNLIKNDHDDHIPGNFLPLSYSVSVLGQFKQLREHWGCFFHLTLTLVIIMRIKKSMKIGRMIVMIRSLIMIMMSTLAKFSKCWLKRLNIDNGGGVGMAFEEGILPLDTLLSSSYSEHYGNCSII